MTGLPHLAACNVSVRFERWGQAIAALAGVGLEVGEGEWVALVGHNGSGKSTLLRAIAGQQGVESGRIEICGREIASLPLPGRARSVFLVHQNPLLGTAPLLTTAENVRVAAPARVSRDWIVEQLRQIGLASRADQPASLLSGGERQLLTLLIAKLRRPSLLLLDEPFSSLDPVKEALALRMLEDVRSTGTALLHITHQLERLDGAASRLVRLEAGHVVEDRKFNHDAGGARIEGEAEWTSH